MSKGTLVSASLALLVVGCGTLAPTSPLTDRGPEPTSRTFLVASLVDSRLPAAGHEAAALTDEDRALAASAHDLALNAASNPAIYWNTLTTELAAAKKLPPPLFARAYALVHAGIADALVSAHDRRRGPLSEAAVAAGAANEILSYLFPDAAERVSAEALAQAGLSEGSGRVLGGWALGRALGRLAVERGKKDGSDAVFAGTIPTGPGLWTGSNPVLPLCGTWKCWLIPAGADFQPEPPYAYGSAEDLRDVEDVAQAALQRTPEQVEIVHKWADRSPPAIWNALLVQRLEAANADPVASARALAWLHTTMTDAFISCWSTKYTYWVARPFQRIPALVTAIPTPNFPSYTSGHSTISAAAAEVMAALFPSEADFFRAEAREAALSRFWAGIHFRHDNDEGLNVGRRIGSFAVHLMREAKKPAALLAAR